MGRIYDGMKAWFANEEWNFEEDPKASILRMNVQASNARWGCIAQAREEQEQYVFYVISPMNAPEDKRQAMAEFITRANYGMVIGNFEMDFNDGELRYKTSVDLEGTEQMDALIRQCLYAGVSTADRYFPGMVGVLHGGMTPLQAVEKVENPPPPEFDN